MLLFNKQMQQPTNTQEIISKHHMLLFNLCNDYQQFPAISDFKTSYVIV